MTTPDFSPAAERNRQPILDVLRGLLPVQGRALEFASGTGQHVAWFAAHLPQWTWQPTELRPEALPGIAARVAMEGLTNVRAPLCLDVLAPEWLPGDPEPYDLIFCANLLHIAPWASCAALMRGAARHLAAGGRVVIYGPFLEDEVATSPGNLAFDQSLRTQDPAWGIRRREDVEGEARAAGLRLAERHPMPANNLLLVWVQEG